MSIDNLISSFDFDKIKNDCLIHEFTKTYIKKKSSLSSCAANDADMLRLQLEDYSKTLEQILKSATCFPAECENCVGMQKCAGCINQDYLADAFIKLQKYLPNKEE